MQRRACIASRMLSSSVGQTLRELARNRAKTKPSPSISGNAHAFTYACASQCADTSVLFINQRFKGFNALQAKQE